eukprot:6482826-Amphidinium_carterae.1
MNVLVDWFLLGTTNNSMQAVLAVECVVAVTGIAALLAHVSLKYVDPGIPCDAIKLGMPG